MYYYKITIFMFNFANLFNSSPLFEILNTILVEIILEQYALMY